MSRDEFDRGAIRDFFKTIMTTPETPARQRLNEATVDDRDTRDPAGEQGIGDLVLALVRGFEVTNSRDHSDATMNKFGPLFKRVLSMNPDLTNSLYEIYREMQASEVPTPRAGSVFGMPPDDEDDGMGPLDVAGSDRAEMVDIVAGEIYDTMDSDSLDIGWYNSLVEDLITAGELDGEMWALSDIDYEDIKDRVIEMEETYGGMQ